MIKKFTLTIAITLFAYLLSSGQCLPDGTILTTQSEVDHFYIEGCSEVEGGILITGWFEFDITNLDGLYMINTIGGSLSFGGMGLGLGNPNLTSLAGLEGLTSIGVNLIISGDSSGLTNLTGLENLSSIGGGLWIDGSPVLASLNGLESLTSIGGDLRIVDNPELASLNGLESLTSIGGDLIITGNTALADLSGLEGLTSIGGNLIIEDDSVLASLSGLEWLTSIGGDLRIADNPMLTDINALENIDYASINDLYIYVNPQLSECNIQSICNYLVAPNGTVEIHDNATGCDSQEEVEQACGITGIGESSVNRLQSSVDIYPNPSSNTITIDLPTQPSKNTFLALSNTNGQKLINQLITKSKTEFDISYLPAGIYFVKVWNDKEVMVRKVVKQ